MDRLDLAACQAQTRERPEDHRAWQALGVACLEHGRPSEAATAFARALGIHPDNAQAAEGLVIAARQTGRWDAVVPVLGGSTLPAARMGLGLAAFHAGDMAQASSLFAEVIRVEPANAEAAYNLAAALGNQGRWAEAAEVFETFLRLAPAEAAAWRGLGRCRSALHQYEEAVIAYQKAVALAGDTAGCHLQLGKALGDLGRWEEAGEALRAAARLEPQNGLAFNALAFAYSKMADGEGLTENTRWTRERSLRAQIGALEMALRLEPDNVAGWRGLARAREAFGDHAGAREANSRASDVARAHADGQQPV